MRQLAIDTRPDLALYRDGQTRWVHTTFIREHYGYRTFHDEQAQVKLLRWLYARVWYTSERPTILFDRTTAWLIEQKILLPGATVLERLIAGVRERAAQRLYVRLVHLLSSRQQTQLQNPLSVDRVSNQITLDELRQQPTRISGPALVEVLERIEAIRLLDVRLIALDHLPINRLLSIYHYARSAAVTTLRNLKPERQLATVLVMLHFLEGSAQDDALDVFEQLMRTVFKKAVRSGEKERLQTLKQLDEAARQLSEVAHVLLDTAIADEDVRMRTFMQYSPQQLAQAIETVKALTRLPDHDYHELLKHNYRSVRRYLPHLLATIDFQGLSNADSVLEAVRFLYDVEYRGTLWVDAPRKVITQQWRPLVLDDANEIQPIFYTFCVLKQLHTYLLRRDIFIESSQRWQDPRAKLFQGDLWQQMRPRVCQMLNLPMDATEAIAQMSQGLDQAYQSTIAQWEDSKLARIEYDANQQAHLVITGLDKVDLSPEYDMLRDHAYSRLPRLDLPDLILEIQHRTQFADEFFHISESQARPPDVEISICAVLMADACNIGLEAVVNEQHPALTVSRLRWVQQNFIREETLANANARLVDAQANIALAALWGGGDVASADGLRFVVPVASAHAETNPHYFGTGRGVTYMNFTSDQFTGFHGIVIPGAVREAIYVLDGLLEQESSLVPTELMTDTAGYTDVIFALFWLLGFRFSPRIADIGSTRFWRINRQADYGPLNEIARHKISLKRVEQHWDDALRIAGSLLFGRVSASDMIQTFRTRPRPSSITKALREIGRIAKTQFLLTYIHDESYRRRVLRQLNHTESRHRLARAIFHGRRGELRQRYRKGQEAQLGALGLVTNIVVLWNTLYLQAVLAVLRREGLDIEAEDVGHLSPLSFDHINFLGRYDFSLQENIQRGQLRPLHQPD